MSSMKQELKERFLKIETVAEMTELSVETIRKWVKERRNSELPFWAGGAHPRIGSSEVCGCKARRKRVKR